MVGITLAQAQEMLNTYVAAEMAVAIRGQAYEILGRRMTRANLAEIQSGRAYWNQQVQTLSRSAAGRSRAVVPVPR